ncbi:hypothetical protein [Zoogloea sp. LCSB751]|uniref:glycine-rich domain-containing protein n=1 Tax=Zoogloea sp. LCSB751 TaxID=1965277 RepID=UPI001C1F2A6F|nr:hypothetical protein [Zoogloea sp. LCSB751]
MGTVKANGRGGMAVVVLLLVLGLVVGAGNEWRHWLPKALFAGVLLVVPGGVWWAWRVRARERFLATFQFPASLGRKLRTTYPHLSSAQAEMVIRELRSFFRVAGAANGRMVSMPSQAVDVAWHEFILFTRGYRQFCARALGRFLDHTPAEHMVTPVSAQQGLRRTWLHACRLEGIDPNKPDRLPVLFALDALLQIPDGFHYVLDCSGVENAQGVPAYCASDIGCGGSCAADGIGDCGSGHGGGHGHGDGTADGGSGGDGGSACSSCGGGGGD